MNTNSSGWTAALTLIAQLAGLGALSGALVAAAVDPRRLWLARRLGVNPRRLRAKTVGVVCVVMLELGGGVYMMSAALKHAQIAVLPVPGGLLLGGLAGAGIAAFARRSALTRHELLVATGVGACLYALIGGAAGHESAALLLIASVGVGASLGMVWVRGVRRPVVAGVSRLTSRSFRSAPPSLQVSCLTGALAGAAVDAGILAAGIQWRAPLAGPVAVVSILTAASLAMTTRGWVARERKRAWSTALAAPSAGVLSRRTINRFVTTVKEVPARDDRAGPPIVFVPGWGTDGIEPWEKVVRILAGRTPRRLIIVVMPLLAAGTDPLDPGPKFQQLVSFLEAAIDRLSPDEPVLLAAHSLGGAVALKLAQKPTARITGVFTIGTLGFDVSPGLKRAAWRVAAAGRAVAPAVPLAAIERIGLAFRRRFNPALDQADLDAFTRNIGDRDEQRRLLHAGQPLLREAVLERLDPRVFCHPVHAVWGEMDRYSPASMAAMLSERRPDITTTVIDGAEHDPHRTHAEQVADLLISSPVFSARS